MSEMDAHLLIVDDDERIRSLLQKFLMRHGFLVTAARDAAHARRILAGLDFDMIVLDVMMPGEDGLRLTRSLRETMQTPAVKVLSMGAIRYDIERGELWQGDDLVRLTATEIQLMRIFAAQPGTALSRSTLVEELGRDRGQAQERAVDVQITRLRRKIEDNPKQPRYLQTVRGAGYMLAPD